MVVFLMTLRHIKISRHGLEIRGSENPTVQGTEDLIPQRVSDTLNVASTVGTFQPRISNPWLLSRYRVYGFSN